MKLLSVVLLSGFFFVCTGWAQSKSLLETCAEKKLKEFKAKTLVRTADEPKLMNTFRIECSKTTYTTPAEKQTLAAIAQAAERQAQLDKAAKEKKEAAAKAAAAAAAKPPAPPPATTKAVIAANINSGTTQPVIGGCGTPAQCEAYMRESRTPKYTWNAPGLQVYLGELWGDSFNLAAGLGGQFEQPENACNTSNQGQIIALDIGSEIIGVACMSNQASQAELKAMAEKIKNTKLSDLPVVIANKRAKYEWKVIKEAPPMKEGDPVCFCTHPGSCYPERVGEEIAQHSCCAVLKCVRIDGGPVKTKKKSEPAKPAEAASPASTPAAAPAAAPAPVPAPAASEIPAGFDAARDGAAGP